MINDPPLLRIRRGFPRPDPSVVGAFHGAATTHVADALGGRGAISHFVRPLEAPSKTLVGVAVTCSPGPGDNLALFAALEVAKPGDILVAATDAFFEAAIAGDLLLGIARNCGIAGLITDGVVRDIKGILSVGLPVFAAGLSANSATRTGPGTVGLSVVIGGVAVDSGDIIVADRDGVVVVPRELAGRTIDRLAEVRMAEASLEAAVAAGLRKPEFLNGVLRSATIEEI
jgi:4-hydroxy-4-methyl-2-oxoglutarate aldolase